MYTAGICGFFVLFCFDVLKQSNRHSTMILHYEGTLAAPRAWPVSWDLAFNQPKQIWEVGRSWTEEETKSPRAWGVGLPRRGRSGLSASLAAGMQQD